MLVGRMRWVMSGLLLSTFAIQAVSATADPPSNISFFLGDDQTEQLTDTEGVKSCSDALHSFYNRSKQLLDLDNGDWQESEMDRDLCRAGLWGCNRSADVEPHVKCPVKAANEVRIAFVILVSDSSWKGAPDISVLQEMLHVLDDPAFQILIHIDQNSSPQLKAAVAVLVQEPRTALVKQQFKCTWGGASITAAQLSALADVYHGYEDDCADFVINLSSADFPVKTAKAIQMHLKNSTQHNFFDFFGKEGSSDRFHDGPDPDTNQKGHHMFIVPECWERPVSIRRTDILLHHSQRRHSALESWQMVVSSQFWVLNRAAVQNLVTSQHVQYLWHFLQHTPVTDESFIATAIHNDPVLRASVRQGAFRFIGKRQSGRLVNDNDVHSLQACKYLFARKFMSGADALRLTNASRTQCT